MDSSLGRYLYLPRGQWYDFWSEKRYDGKQEIYIKSGLEQIPVFVQAGAIIPLFPEMNYVGEKKVESLTMRTYYCHEQVRSELFEDRGEGYDYTRGYFNRKTFKVKGNDVSLKILQNSTGQFQPAYATYSMEIIDIPFKVNRVVVDDKSIGWGMKKGTLEFKVTTTFTNIDIE